MKSFNRFIDDETHDLLVAIRDGDQLADAMRDVTVRHADRLSELGEVRVLALDPCPNCTGGVIASDTEARCAAGCGWSYHRHGVEPVASTKAPTC